MNARNDTQRHAPTPDAHIRRTGRRVASATLAGAMVVLGLVSVPSVGVSATTTSGGPMAPSTTSIGSGASRVPVSLWNERSPGDAPAAARKLVKFRPSTQARVLKLNRAGMREALREAPLEFTRAGRRAPLRIALPAPNGSTKRFAITESPVMMPKLARKHPDIKTYVGRSLAGGSTIRIAMTPLGFSASVRGTQGSWYLEPAEHLDQSRYLSYYRRDLRNIHGDVVEQEIERENPDVGTGQEIGTMRVQKRVAPVGHTLRTYRIALVSDPNFGSYWGYDSDPENVTIGKVLIANRLNQVYEDSFAIRLLLANGNDKLNFNTFADMTGTNGPCGTVACYSAAQIDNCADYSRSTLVAGLLIGADNFDIGHMMLGAGDGGVAQLGVVGRWYKVRGCTALPSPGGDGYAVDYVGHEVGHQFNADHTYSGTGGSCSSDQFSSNSAVEPGSGATIMSYAGICSSQDNQAYNDPYFSQKSFDQVTDFAASGTTTYSEVQQANLRNFDGTDSFRLRYNGNNSAVITNGTNYTAAGIKAAIEGITGWPVGATVTVAGPITTISDSNNTTPSASGSPTSNGFAVTFGGTLANNDAAPLSLQNVNGFIGVLGTIVQGGASTNNGYTVTETGNLPPQVTAPAPKTIPMRTPFALTASGSDVNGDTLTYQWEQNNTIASQVSLLNPTKTTGPIFRVFGTWGDPNARNGQQSPGGGTNTLSTNPTRYFPDMAQIAANNTNAETGACPAGTSLFQRECFSEWLPTANYSTPMAFRVTANDGFPGAAGINNADTTISVTSLAGPFLVTSQPSIVSYDGKTDQAVSWNVANTTASPVNTANVKISLSADGGLTFPYVLKESTPNDGSEVVKIPNVDTTEGRIKVEAVGNYFFDINNANISITKIAASQTITFAPLANKTYGDANFNINPTASSGLPVTVLPSGPCTLTGSTVAITGAGICTLTASQAGDEDYFAAGNVVRSFTIAKKANTITFGGLPSKTYGDPNFLINPTSSAGLSVTVTPTGPCTVTGNLVSLTGVGSCTLTASQAGNDNVHAATNVVRTFAIAARKTTTSLKIKPAKVKVGKPATFTTTVKSSGGTVAPAGTVTLYIGATVIGSGSTDAQGVSTLVITVPLPKKKYKVKAVFADPAENFLGSSSKLVKFTIKK